MTIYYQKLTFFSIRNFCVNHWRGSEGYFWYHYLNHYICDSVRQYPFILKFFSDYKEYHTDTSVRFVITFTPEQFVQAEQEGFYKKFKLETFLHTSCMVSKLITNSCWEVH